MDLDFILWLAVTKTFPWGGHEVFLSNFMHLISLVFSFDVKSFEKNLKLKLWLPQL